MHVSATHERNDSVASETKSEVTDMKDLRTSNLKGSLPETCFPNILWVSDRKENDGSEEPETEHEDDESRKSEIEHTNVNSVDMVAATKTAAEDTSRTAGKAAAVPAAAARTSAEDDSSSENTSSETAAKAMNEALLFHFPYLFQSLSYSPAPFI